MFDGGLPNISAGAGSGNGDTVFDSTASFGGLNINKGVPPWALALSAIAALLLTVYLVKA